MKAKVAVFSSLLSFIILFTLGVTSCGKNDASPKRDNNGQLQIPAQSAKITAELEARRERLKAMIRDKYDLGETRASRDRLIRDLITAINKGDDQTVRALVMNDQQYGEIFWPNQPERFTMNHGMSPKTAVSWARMKRNMGLQSLRSKLRGRKVIINKITWKKKTREMNALQGHDLHGVEVLIDGRKDSLREIRIAVVHRGRWKVAVINTD